MRNTNLQRYLALVLAVLMMMTSFNPAFAFADSNDVTIEEGTAEDSAGDVMADGAVESSGDLKWEAEEIAASAVKSITLNNTEVVQDDWTLYAEQYTPEEADEIITKVFRDDRKPGMLFGCTLSLLDTEGTEQAFDPEATVEAALDDNTDGSDINLYVLDEDDEWTQTEFDLNDEEHSISFSVGNGCFFLTENAEADAETAEPVDFEDHEQTVEPEAASEETVSEETAADELENESADPEMITDESEDDSDTVSSIEIETAPAETADHSDTEEVDEVSSDESIEAEDAAREADEVSEQNEVVSEEETEAEKKAEKETDPEQAVKSDDAESVKNSVRFESSIKDNKYLKTYRYEDGSVVITAEVSERGVIDEHASFVCEKIDEKSEEYHRLRNKLANYYEVTDDMINIFPYDVSFIVGEKEVEPDYGTVKVTFEYKEPIEVEKGENVEVLHVPDGKAPEVLSDDVVTDGAVESFAVEMQSFSPVTVAKTNLGGVALKSIQKTDGSGNDYYISKTSNIDDSGVATSQYSNRMNVTDTVEVDGALYYDVTITFGGEGVGCDWLYIKDGNGNILYTDADGKTVGYSQALSNGSYRGKIGGGSADFSSYTSKSNTKEPAGTVSYRFETDALQFTWRTDGSVTGYGYYAVVTPFFSTTPVPDFHFEELEDGTYALVFDKGGDIEAFTSRPDVREAIADYKGNISEIRLHKDTTSVDKGAFKGLTSLRTVTMPRNSQLTKIGKNAFAGCDNLESFSIPASVTEMDGTAFSGCVTLESVSFASGNTMTTLPNGLFEGLTSLTNVSLPVGLTAIPNNLFYNCSSLREIEVPESVTSIGDNAFRNTRIPEVPDLTNITSIGSMAFSNNPNLKTVTIPANITTLGDAFRQCTGITDFVFEDGTSFQTLPADFFQGMTKLKNVKLPDDLTRISNEMFSGCSSLEHVDFPETVVSIGNNAFYNCTKLQDFEIPATVKSIGTGAFKNCDAFKDMVIPNTVTSVGTELFYDCNNLLRVQFESGSPIRTLPSSMFYNCTSLESVKLPDGVTAIPASYFRGCTTLQHVDIPENLTSIGDYAFYDCRRLENPEFPSTLKTIGTQAFYNCDSITEVTIPNSVTSLGTYAFQDCTALQSFVWEEGSPMTSLNTYMFYNCVNLENLVLPTGLTAIPDYMAASCRKLTHVEIPSGVKTIGSNAFDGCTLLDDVVLPEACTQIYSYAFRNSGLTHIELPSRMQSIGSYAFYNTKISSVIIPKATTSISSYAFQNNSRLETVLFEDEGQDVKVQMQAFADNMSLREFITNGRITYIGQGMLMNDRRLEEYVIDPRVTDVSGRAFYNDLSLKRLEIQASPTGSALNVDPETSSSRYNYTFGKLTSLEELIVDRDLTSSYTRTGEFIDLNPNVHITIGKNVNKLDNMLVSTFVSDMDITFEGENDFTVTTRVTNQSTDVKWSELKGDFYVDPDGVVYKLNNTDNTASLFYIPKGITSYTVPATVTSVAGKTYNVTHVDSYVGRSADDLTALTFENPSAVTIPQFAFTGCTSLQTINDLPELYPEDWAEVSLMCDFPIHTDQVSEQVLLLNDSIPVEGGGDGASAFSFAVSISNQEKMDEDNPLTYVYPTGRSARLDFAISNESNVDMSDRVIRVYLAFSGENYALGNYPPGDYTLVNTSTGARYPFSVHTTDAKGVYYYDITGFKPGDTLAFNNQFAYASPTSGGGEMRVWIESISAAEAAEKEGKTSQPTRYMLAEWYTKPTPYVLEKSVLSNPQFSFTANTSDEDDDNVYVKNMQYRIRLSSGGSSGNSYAKDYIKYIDMYDDLQLTENMVWSPDVIDAVRGFNYYYNPNGYLYVKLDGKWTELCHFSFPDTSLVRSMVPVVVTDDNGNPAIRLCWSYRNTYWSNATTAPTAEMPATTYDLYLGSRAVQVKQGSDLWRMFREGAEFTDEESLAMRQVANKAHEISHYSYSEDQELDAETINRQIYMTTGFTMSKSMTGSGTFGREHEYDISVSNTGLVHKDDIDLITDALRNHYYIKADNMESMFNDSKWGPFLRIDMTSLTLCELPDKEAVDIYGNSLTIMDAQYSGIDPIPYNGCAPAGSDASETVTDAKFSLFWDDNYDHIVLEVKNDAGEVQQTYSIGDGCDFASIDEVFKSIGYVVTYRAQYTVTWDLDNKYTLYQAHKDGLTVDSTDELTPEQLLKYEYRLKSGRTDVFHIASNVKRTDMFLVNDTPGRYNNGSSISSGNTAYARDSSGRQVGVGNWSGYISYELYLSKSATANGQTWNQNIQIPDDTVIDYTLSFTNSGDEYDVLPLTDKMGGAQVLLVPVRTNRNALYYPAEGSEGIALQNADLDIYTASGIQYYVLDKEGTYKEVVIDGRITDTISVSKTTGSAQTLMIWYYQNLEGYTTTSSSTSKHITYKALADSSRLGGKVEDEQGSTVTSSTLSNQSWLGGHQTHRLYASLYGSSEQLQFIKKIVEDPNSAHENLIDHSLIEEGDEVLYKMVIQNTGESAATIKGNRIRDELPTTSGIFPWSKDNVLDIYYVTENLGSTVETVSPDYWYVDSIEPLTGADTASRGLYYIKWTNDFKIELEGKGEVWIYVRLKFPDEASAGANTWDNYLARNNGGIITNYFYIDERQSHVTHELVDVVEGMLQKGVLDTGLSSAGKFQSEDTRHYYQNGGNTDNGSAQEVAYYTVLYNSGNVRLYLDPLQDQLPKGFKFRGLINGIPRAANNGSGYTTTYSNYYYNTLGSYYTFNTLYNTEYYGSSNSTYMPVATVQDENRAAVTYKNAYISVTKATDDSDHEQVTFNIGSRSYGNLKYDSELQKYYLDPGEAIRFGYMCTVEGYARTENVANNEVSMPIYDKYGLGAQMSDPEDVQVVPAIYRDIAVNDGACDLLTTEEETAGRMHTKPTWARSTTEWFSSNVSLQRLSSVPGIQKTVGGETYIAPGQTIQPDQIYGSKYSDSSKTGTMYVGTVARTSIVNWMIRLYNEGGVGTNSMEDYTIVDTVDAPYMFTGNFFYDYYNVNGTKVSSSSVPVFSLGGRSANDQTVKISTTLDTMTLDGTITVNGDPVSVDNGRATVQLLRDENGVETLRIRLKDNYHRIPPNSYMAMVGHTQYVSSDAVLSKQFYNHVQLEPSSEFDPALVSQGKVLYRTDDGDEIPYAIESGASVTMTAGYTSAARKQVTQMDATSNTGWSDKNKNYIQLPEKYSKFFYDLYIDLPKDDPTQKLVLIDALPEVGDHSPFVDRDMRDSEFKVHITGEDPGFKVWSSANLGTGTKTELTYDQYTLEVNTRHEFVADDWEGVASDWTLINLADGVSEEEQGLLDAARAFRIIINDANLLAHPDQAVMGKNYQVQVRFNGELESPEEANPGAIAWNSFGYRYTVPIGATGMSTTLNAEPLKVGVQVPAVPYIIKDQKTPHNHYKPIETASEYHFLIYTGAVLDALNDLTDKDLPAIAQILKDNGRDFTISSIQIPGGFATGRTQYLDSEKKWDLADGQVVETEEHWIWNNAAKYSILELPFDENGFTFSDIAHSPNNNYTFTQNSENVTILRVTNVYGEKGRLKLQKTVQGPNFDPDRRFTFTIQLKDGRYPAFGTYNYTGTNIRDGSLTFDDTGTASIQLKHNQAIELQDMPAGYTYKITESDDVLYDSAGTNAEGTIQSGGLAEASFVNTRKDTSLNITKTVSGNFGNRTKMFDFEVYIVDEGRELSGAYDISIAREGGSTTAAKINFVEGAATFQLSHGDVATISGLPVGARYEVDELAASRRGYETSSTNEAGVLTEEAVTSVWTNTKNAAVPTNAMINGSTWFIFLLIPAAVYAVWEFIKRRRKS